MPINPNIVREYDIRGIYKDTLTDRDAYLIGFSLTKILKKNGLKGSVSVCRDGRHSSPKLCSELVKGIQNGGYQVVDLGVGPTPLLYYSNYILEDLIAGVMVTGSHNPPEYNGFKFIVDKKPFYGAQITELSKLSIGVDYYNNHENYYIQKDLREEYVQYLLARVTESNNLKIVWDAGNGAAGEVLEMLCKKLPGEHVLLNTKIDGDFPVHHPDPTVEENLVQIKSEIKKHGAHFGVAFDGDGDRIGIVNADEQTVWGDQLLVILAKEVINKLGPVSIIADVKSSKKLFDKIKEYGGYPVMWKTGHSNIKTKMMELNSPLAGEMSGHIFYKDDYFGYDDALFAAIRFINCYLADRECINNTLQDFSKVVSTPEIRITCSEKRKFIIIDEIKAYLDGRGHEYNGTDGIRMDSDDGWWLIRASNTQNVLVARVEGSSQEVLDELMEEFKAILALFDIDLENGKVDE